MSLVAHIAVIFSPETHTPVVALSLGAMLVIVWLPLTAVYWWMKGELSGRQAMRSIDRASPRWIRYLVFAALVYAYLNSGIFAWFNHESPRRNVDEKWFTQVGTSFLLALYSAAFQLLTLAYRHGGEATKPKTDGTYPGA